MKEPVKEAVEAAPPTPATPATPAPVKEADQRLTPVSKRPLTTPTEAPKLTVPSDKEPSVSPLEEKFREIVRNKETAGLKATFGAPFTTEYVKGVYDKIAAEKGQEEADRLLDSTVGIAKGEARNAVTQALGTKFYDAFSAWPKADAQLVSAVKSGSIAATDDQLRVLGISKDQISEAGP